MALMEEINIEGVLSNFQTFIWAKDKTLRGVPVSKLD